MRRVELTQDIKLRLLQALRDGYVDLDTIPELSLDSYFKGRTREELEEELRIIRANREGQ